MVKRKITTTEKPVVKCPKCDGIGRRLYVRKGMYEKGKVKRVWMPHGWYCENCRDWIIIEDWVKAVYAK